MYYVQTHQQTKEGGFVKNTELQCTTSKSWPQKPYQIVLAGSLYTDMPKRQPQATLRTPHPFHVFLNNSHPPLDARLKAIRDYHGKCYNESMWVAQPAKEKWLSVAVTPRFVNRAPCSCLREVGSRLGWFILRCVVFMGMETCVRFACTKYDECLEVYGILVYILVCTCILPEVQQIFTGVLLSGATTQHTCRTWVQRPTRLHAFTACVRDTRFIKVLELTRIKLHVISRFLQYLSAKSCLDFAQFSARRPWQPHDL